jgi:heat shock protein HslJ
MMLVGRRRAAALIVTTFALAGCNAATPTGSTDTGALVGPTWTLVTLNGQPPVSGTTVTAVFTTESRVAGSAGCNSYFGRAAAETGRVSIGPLGSTLMACHPESVMAQESAYLRALETATRFVVSGDELRLGPSTTEATLVFSSR